jgi:eukaryotic-like serine/threonine-protein kinase
VSDVFLASRLQAALGDAYRLERELPAGGMSRLFLATETSLDREVVIKVLPPELASDVSASRFKHEINVAAHLQHPHILSILAAGSREDLLYYVMPYVPGESLRHRLAAVRQLPIDEAVRILREVADALAYAHRKGVVHRDIKPENILLLEGHAVLADFGVARAIIAARSGNLTESGTSVGTPAYMAPEQAAAEPNIDARADIYALGIVGYEMLTGALPFTGSTAQAVLKAHLTEPPPPPTKTRADTPSSVSSAITKALAKAPEDRFSDAGEFRDALTTSGARKAYPKRLVAGFSGLLVAAVLSALVMRQNRASQPVDSTLLAVAPFDVTASSLKLWHEGMVDVLSRNLDGAGALRTVSPSVVIQRWSGRADPASARALGLATGARFVLVGALSRVGASVKATLEIVDARDGHTLGSMIERRANAGEIDGLADSLTVSVLRELGRERAIDLPHLALIGTSSISALKSFLEGEQSLRRGAYDSALAHYEQAVGEDSEFAIAAMRASLAADWWDKNGPKASEYAQLAHRWNHRLSARDSLRIEIQYLFVYETRLYRYPDVNHAYHKLFETTRAAVKQFPDDPDLWYALGEAGMHGSEGSKEGASPSEIKQAFDRSIMLDSTFAPAYVHLVELGLRESRASGRRYLAEYLRRKAGHKSDDLLLVDALTLAPQFDSALVDSVLRSASSEQLTQLLFVFSQFVDSNETSLNVTRGIVRQIRGRKDAEETQALAGQFLVMRGRVNDALAIGVRSSGLAHLALFGAIPQHLADSLMSAAYLANQIGFRMVIGALGIRGDTLELRRYIRMRDTMIVHDTTGQMALVTPYVTAITNGFTQLARHDTAAAMRTFSSLPDSLCIRTDCAYVWLVKERLLAAQGRWAEAAKILNSQGVPESALGVYAELERGLVAEKLGDRARAIDAYSYVEGMWRNADPPFQGYVADARAGLSRLAGEKQGVRIQ